MVRQSTKYELQRCTRRIDHNLWHWTKSKLQQQQQKFHNEIPWIYSNISLFSLTNNLKFSNKGG